MQYKMLNEILEVSMDIKTVPINNETALDALRLFLIDKSGWTKLTAKQKRVLNALETVYAGEQQRKERGKKTRQVLSNNSCNEFPGGGVC